MFKYNIINIKYNVYNILKWKMHLFKENLYFIFFAIILSHSVLAINAGKESDQNLLKKEIQIAIDSLGSENSFAFFKLHLSEQELKALQNININATDENNNYGNINRLHSELNEFINMIGNNDKTNIEKVSKIIVRMVKNIIQASGKKTAWVCLRSFIATSSYDQPRWHTDGYYYKPFSGKSYKFAIILKGPSTLFYKLPREKNEKFFSLQNEGNEQNGFNRQNIIALLGNSQKFVFSSPPNHGAVFIVGSANAAVHSEPPIKEERLFLSIVPGSKKQIQEWKSIKVSS